MRMDEKEADPSFIHGVKALAEISVALGAGLFLVGWSYLYGYYHAFGLSANELSFSLQGTFMYSLPVIQTCRFVLAFLVLVALLFIGGRFPVITRALSQAALILVIAVLAGIAASSYAISVGRANASRDSFVSSSTLPYVKLEGESADLGVGGCSLDEWNYRFLLRSNGQIYVILPVGGTKKLTAANLRVCGFPDSRVRAIRIQVGLGEGEGND
jgi:hypothetical protein